MELSLEQMIDVYIFSLKMKQLSIKAISDYKILKSFQNFLSKKNIEIYEIHQLTDDDVMEYATYLRKKAHNDDKLMVKHIQVVYDFLYHLENSGFTEQAKWSVYIKNALMFAGFLN